MGDWAIPRGMNEAALICIILVSYVHVLYDGTGRGT